MTVRSEISWVSVSREAYLVSRKQRLQRTLFPSCSSRFTRCERRNARRRIGDCSRSAPDTAG